MKDFYNITKSGTRMEFFQNTMILFVTQLVCALVFWYLTTFVNGIKSILWLTPLFLIFVEIPLLCLFFIQSGKRIYSILGTFYISMIVNIILFPLFIAGILFFPSIVVLIYVMLLLIPERAENE